MAIQDLTLYIETDPNSRFTVTTTKVDIVGLRRDETAHVYDDKGVDFFDGDLEIDFEIYSDSSASNSYNLITCGLTNIVDDWTSIDTASGDGISVLVSRDVNGGRLMVQELDGGTSYNTFGTWFDFGHDTLVYCTFTRVEADGAFGTIYLKTYSDSGRTTLIDTQTLALHTSKKDYRYFFAAMSNNDGGAVPMTGFVQDFEIISPLDPQDIAVPKVDFNFTEKVPAIDIQTPTVIAIPVVTFNFTRFAPTVRVTDVAVAIPKADFNFTPKVFTLDLTEKVALSIPAGSFNFTTKAFSVVLTNTEEEINFSLYDVAGEPITGALPTIIIHQRATGFFLDWSDNTYKAAGGTTPSDNMQEKNAAILPGHYFKIIQMTQWSDGWYLAWTTYDATPKQNGDIEFLIKDGVVSDSFNTSNLDVAVSSRASATKQDTIKTVTDLMDKWIKNGMNPGDTLIELLDDNGQDVLLSWVRDPTTGNRSKATE